MKISLIAARAENDVIGNGPDIPWRARGEQLLFKALTFNRWLLVGRKTFESMGKLPDRRFAVISAGGFESDDPEVVAFASVESALDWLASQTDEVMVAGGGQIYHQCIDMAEVLHLTRVHCQPQGDVHFPPIPTRFERVYSQKFQSNTDYSYELWLGNQTSVIEADL